MSFFGSLRRASVVAFGLMGASAVLADGNYIPVFSADDYIAHIKFLADDSLGGRKPGTDGIEKAADYIADHFQTYGLKPGGENETWFQPFKILDGKRFTESAATLALTGCDEKLVLGVDWNPLSYTAPGSCDGKLAFAGYGIEAPDDNYNDFADFDATGKVLLVLRYEPRADDPKAKFGGEAASSHSLFSRKARIAAAKGARGLLIVNPPNRDPAEDTLLTWNKDEARVGYDLPMAHITRAAADRLLKAAGMPDLKTLTEKLDRERKSLSRDMGNVTVNLTTGVDFAYTDAKNVIGVLRGTEAPDEYIVVGGHYDHVGTTRRFDKPDEPPQVHNGADDNASGSAGVLELARAFAKGPRPRRSIIFMTFSAEELGLLGSEHYSNNPTVPIDHIKAMINFDMIGRLNQNKLTIEGLDTATEFAPLINAAAASAGLKFSAPGTDDGFFGRSDQASFYHKNIPVLFTFTGEHKQYHKPDDDWELIHHEGAVRLLSMWYPLIDHIANMTDGPTFQKPEKKDAGPVAAADTSGGDKGDKKAATTAAGGSDTARPSMPRVRLGIMPSYNEDGKPGMLIDGVAEKGSAHDAGMKDGDRILKIGKFKVSNIQTYMGALSELNPGDEVDIVVDRAGQEVTLKAKLTAPPGPQRE